jgi:hypothetical protein
LWANPQERIRLSSKPYNHTVRRKSGQPAERTGFPDDFHIGENCAGRVAGELAARRSRAALDERARVPVPTRGVSTCVSTFCRWAQKLRATVWVFRLVSTAGIAPDFGAAEAEDRKLRKDPCLEVLALKVPFGKLLLRHSRITSRGRDNLKA